VSQPVSLRTGATSKPTSLGLFVVRLPSVHAVLALAEVRCGLVEVASMKVSVRIRVQWGYGI